MFRNVSKGLLLVVGFTYSLPTHLQANWHGATYCKKSTNESRGLTSFMKTYVLVREQVVNQSIDKAFEFFGNAYNLEKITPSFLKFRILTQGLEKIRAGSVIDYSLSLFFIPFKWQTLIEAWQPGEYFIDRQIKGPYKLWVHKHTFEKVSEGQTRVRDEVRYEVPFGFLGTIAHVLFVGPSLKRIFDFRAMATRHALEEES